MFMYGSVVAQRIGSYRDVLVLREDHPSHEDVFSAEVEDGTIRIKVLACGLDFPTMLVMEGKHMMKKSPPFVPGSDVCGVVSAVGSDARDFDISIGDIVFGVSQTGAMSEYALMLLENAYKVPKGVSPAIAAGFEMNYGTTYHGLVDLANLKKGETLLVLGASTLYFLSLSLSCSMNTNSNKQTNTQVVVLVWQQLISEKLLVHES